MSRNYEYHNKEDKTTLVVGANANDRSKNDLYVCVSADYAGRAESMSVNGIENIKEVLYAMAVEGGLIEEGATLIIEKSRPLPEDGTYLLNANGSTAMVLVEDGKLLLPQSDFSGATGYLVDSTNQYTKSDSKWTLTEMVRP